MIVNTGEITLVNSNSKGKRGELEAAKLLKDHGFEARRGQQYSGGDDSPDVVHGMEGFHIEVKRTETLSIYKAMAQALEDKGEDDTPLVLHRRSRKDWLVIIPAEDFLKLMREYVYD